MHIYPIVSKQVNLPIINLAKPNTRYKSCSHKNDLQNHSVLFGNRANIPSKWNVVFVTPEYPEFGKASVGGLGRVSQLIPDELNNKDNGGPETDTKVIIPGFKPLLDDNTFKSTGISFEVEGYNGNRDNFEVLQKQEGNSWVYMLKNDTFLTPLTSFYTYSPSLVTDGNELNRSIEMFNRAVAKFLPLLNQSSNTEEGKPLKQFIGNAHIVMANDWPTTAFFKKLPADYKVAKIMMLHNESDKGQNLEEAVKNGIFKNVDEVKKYFNNYYSPLGLGLHLADGVIACKNYVISILERMTGKVEYTKPLQKLFSADKIYPVHHNPGDRYNPFNNNILNEKPESGFTLLKLEPFEQETISIKTPVKGLFNKFREKLYNKFSDFIVKLQKGNSFNKLRTILINWFSKRANNIKRKLELKFPTLLCNISTGKKELYRFKQINKLAVQKELNLNTDPNAVVFTWIARLDPYQKGVFMLLDNCKQFLKEHEKAQIVIAAATSDAKVNVLMDKFKKDIASDAELKGRTAILGHVQPEHAVKIGSGSTFLVHPSLYEPFGLAHLEEMMIGTVPVVHGVDGLYASVYDPDIKNIDSENKEFYQKADSPSSDHGQTGFMMKRIKNIPKYQEATSEYIETGYKNITENLDIQSGEEFKHIRLEANKSLYEAMDRAYKMAVEQPEKLIDIAANGWRYVNKEHSWKNIIPKYKEAFEKAWKVFQDKENSINTEKAA